jgi:hypothetical protein
MRRWFIGIGAASAILLGANQLWNQPVLLGTNTKFELKESDGRLVLLQRSKEHQGWIKLRLRNSQRFVDRPHATVEQAGLAVLWEDDCWCVSSTNWRATQDRKFLWNSGVPVEFWIEGRPLTAADLMDWEVHVKDGPPDSPECRLWRRSGNGFLVLIVCLTALGVLVSSSKSPTTDQPEIKLDNVMGLLIARVKGDNDKETQILRDLLARVTSARDPEARQRAFDSAMDAWSIKPKRRNATWFKARARLQAEAKWLAEELKSSIGWKP